MLHEILHTTSACINKQTNKQKPKQTPPTKTKQKNKHTKILAINELLLMWIMEYPEIFLMDKVWSISFNYLWIMNVRVQNAAEENHQ